MDTSIFADKQAQPDDNQLIKALGATFDFWKEIETYVLEKYPAAIKEWNFSGIKYGWSFRIKDKKRVIIYLLPRDNYFKVAFVFGQKATDNILQSDISSLIKTELELAKVFAEGRGIRLDVREKFALKDILMLVDVKLEF